jgi:hypothetical protein
MNDSLEYIAAEWRERAKELAAWVMRHMVNRTDVWGRYVRKRGVDGHQALTVPFKEERGKSFLDESSLEKHFKVRSGNGVFISWQFLMARRKPDPSMYSPTESPRIPGKPRWEHYGDWLRLFGRPPSLSRPLHPRLER